MTLQRLRGVLNIAEHVDLGSAEQAANARIFQLYHKLHDLARRDRIAKDLNDRGMQQDNDLKTSRDEEVGTRIEECHQG